METLKINYVGKLPIPAGGSILAVESEQGYCRASRLLREDFAAAYKAIWVSEEHLFAWLRWQVEFVGLAQERPVEFHRTTPSSLLADRWKVEIPSWLTDDFILAEKLLEHPLPAEATGAASGLLEPLFGALPETLPAKLAGPLAEKASRADVTEGLQRPVLRAAWEAMIDQWTRDPGTAASTATWREGYCARLMANPESLWRDLTLWRLLRGYPQQVAGFAFDPASEVFVRGLPPEAWRDMKLSPEGRCLALEQVKLVAESLGKEAVTRKRFEGFLEAVSGELPEEFAAVESLLGQAAFEIAAEDLQAVRRRFAKCEGLSAARLSALDPYVRPPRPEALEEQSPGATEWVSWALEQYLPYRWWQIQRREADPGVEKSVAAFG